MKENTAAFATGSVRCIGQKHRHEKNCETEREQLDADEAPNAGEVTLL